MKVKFKGRTIKENNHMEIECDMLKDSYTISQRDISIIITVNEKSIFSLKEYLEIEILN